MQQVTFAIFGLTYSGCVRAIGAAFDAVSGAHVDAVTALRYRSATRSFRSAIASGDASRTNPAAITQVIRMEDYERLRPRTLATAGQNLAQALGAGGEIPNEQQGKRRLSARRSVAVVPERGWYDTGADIATHLG